MLYPNSIESKLGFDVIKSHIQNNCISSLGLRFVEKIKFSTDEKLILRMLKQVEEFKNLFQQDYYFPSSNFFDLSANLNTIIPENSFLTERDFFDLKLSVQTIFKCVDCLVEYQEDFPELFSLTNSVEIEHDCYTRIDGVIDDQGKVRDKASPDLFEIRSLLHAEAKSLRKETERLNRLYQKEGFIEDGIEPTLRNGRMVLPVKVEYKRKVKGFIHDESATGQTVFIEPSEIFEINNTIKELVNLEKRELVKILTRLTDYIRPQLDGLKKSFSFLGLIDFIRAKALLAIDMNAINPTFVKQANVDWKEAKHPLLLLAFKDTEKKVVPLDIQLNQQNHLLLISGPNAGGKSVCLKTVGLLQFMYQSGILVPVGPDSTFGLFKDLFIDIGDEQSIENDLSTYSAHLTHMKFFMKHADKKTLLLIDEFGTGTEPTFGAAIAESVLEDFVAKKSFGVITTHYANLKSYATHTPGLINGSMTFDAENLQPLYSLEIGTPGSSFAIEIATKIGLPQNIIENSKQKIGSEQVALDKMLRVLEKEKHKYRSLLIDVKAEQKKVQKKEMQIEEVKAAMEVKRKTFVNDAKKEAKLIVDEANKMIERTIREIRENKADKESTKDLRSQVENYKEQLEKDIQKNKKKNIDFDEVEKLEGPIESGDFVRFKDSETVAQVVSVNKNNLEIMIGALKSNIKSNRVFKISHRTYKKSFTHKEESVISSGSGKLMMERSSKFSPHIDIRGMRGEEAVDMVERLMDDAILLGITDLKIVHGKGDGILRPLIREKIKSYSEMVSMSDEHADRGGAGITLVKLKF